MGIPDFQKLDKWEDTKTPGYPVNRYIPSDYRN